MQRGAFFQKALGDFTHEAASGGAIRHLADLGYTVEEIREELAFPTPYAKVQGTVWKHLLDTGVILDGEVQNGPVKEKVVYVREYDQYGRPSFRRMVQADHPGKADGLEINSRKPDQRGPGADGWKSLPMPQDVQRVRSLLAERVAANGVENAYVSCDFGLIAMKDTGCFEEMLRILDGRLRGYVEGLPWERKRVYHRLDPRMLEIILRLYEAGMYQGVCFFLKTGERLELRA